MRLRLTIFGYEVLSIELGPSDEAEAEAEALSAGATHNFERDTDPLDPTDHYGEWEDKRTRASASDERIRRSDPFGSAGPTR